MTALALPKTNELFNEINSYIAKKRKPTAWQVKLLKKKADTLRGKIPENHYYDVLGMISCLEQDIDELSRNYQAALNLASTDFQVQDHYITALHNKGLYSKAVTHGKMLLANFPEYPETILSWLVKCAFMSCRIGEASYFLSLINAPDKHPFYQRINTGKAIFESAQLSDDEAERLQNLAFSIIQKSNLYFSTIATTANRDCIHYQIYVDLPIEDIFEINSQLADVLIENTGNTFSDAILFEYESVDVFEESLAS